MTPQTLLSFRHELTKLAFGPEQAQRVLSLAKRIQLPKASGKIQPGLSAGPGYKSLVRGAKSSANLVGMGDMAEQAVKASPVARVLKANKGPAIFPGSGSFESQIEKGDVGRLLGRPAHVPADQKKMLHAVVKGHELDESSVKARLGAAHFGHRSPDVIYREHNRLATLPKGNEQVKGYMQHLRSQMEGPALMPKGMTFGEGPRLSRHARRRLTDLRENQMVEGIKSSMEPPKPKTTPKLNQKSQFQKAKSFRYSSKA